MVVMEEYQTLPVLLLLTPAAAVDGPILAEQQAPEVLEAVEQAW
jgi:hypothetical protein